MNRQLAADLLRVACHSTMGRRQFDPVFDDVTEERQGRGYSGCADLGHWLLYRLGYRYPWVNRAEWRGWKPGLNLSLLCAKVSGGANPFAFRPTIERRFEPGDILTLSSREPSLSHIVVCLNSARYAPGEALVVGQYGQWSPKYGRASGRMSHYILYQRLGRISIGTRPIDSHLSLDDLVATAEPESVEQCTTRIVDECRTLSLNQPRMRGNDVLWWSERMLEENLDPGVPYNVYGPKATACTKSIQKRLNRPETGDVIEAEWKWAIGAY